MTEYINPYRVKVSHRFLTASVLLSVLVAFIVGRTARIYVLLQNTGSSFKSIAAGANLPNPILPRGKSAPHSKYTSKHFDTPLTSSSNSRWIIIEEDPQECASTLHSDATNTTTHDLDEVYFPKGQHLLLDIKYVDSTFLASEERLANTMMEVVNSCGLTLLSYHCHALKSAGVKCVGFLLESHVSFHTFPTQGVIMFDLFTCGESSLLPIVPEAIKAFSIPRKETMATATMKASYIPKRSMLLPEPVWAYKFRGFGGDDEDTIDLLTDLFTFPIGTMTDYKKEIISVYTKKHRIDIYDVLRPHFQLFSLYRRSIEIRSSYEYKNRDTFVPDRLLFIDGRLELRRSGEKTFHEALIHPAMFAHFNPKRVIVIGCYGAHLREVLKHKTVEKVLVIQRDREVVDITQDYLPDFSECGTGNCFDDSRIEMVYAEPNEWLREWCSSEKNENKEPPFDIIIMDDMSFLENSYHDEALRNFISSSLAPTGIFAAHVGEAPDGNSPTEEYSYFKYRHQLIGNLSMVGFESIRDYEEGHSGDGWPLTFLVAFKDRDSEENWFRSEASINLEIRKRAVPSDASASPFQYFDGATMRSYMYPSKFSETVYCRRNRIPDSCPDEFIGGKNVHLAKLEEGTVHMDLEKRYSIRRQEKTPTDTYDPAADRKPDSLFVSVSET